MISNVVEFPLVRIEEFLIFEYLVGDSQVWTGTQRLRGTYLCRLQARKYV